MRGDSSNRKYLIWFWTLFILPFLTVIILFLLISGGKLGPIPSFRELENPEYYLQRKFIPKTEYCWARSALRTGPGPILRSCHLI